MVALVGVLATSVSVGAVELRALIDDVVVMVAVMM